MRKLLVGAAALLASLTGAMVSASPAEAAMGGHGGGGGFHGGGGGFHGGAGGFHRGGFSYRGGYGYRGGWGYRGGGWGPGLVAGLAVGAALAGPYYYGPPAPYYPAYYGCARHWVWTGYGYRPVRACY